MVACAWLMLTKHRQQVILGVDRPRSPPSITGCLCLVGVKQAQATNYTGVDRPRGPLIITGFLCLVVANQAQATSYTGGRLTTQSTQYNWLLVPGSVHSVHLDSNRIPRTRSRSHNVLCNAHYNAVREYRLRMPYKIFGVDAGVI